MMPFHMNDKGSTLACCCFILLHMLVICVHFCHLYCEVFGVFIFNFCSLFCV